MNDDFKRADDDIADGVTTSELIPALFGALNTVSDSADVDAAAGEVKQ